MNAPDNGAPGPISNAELKRAVCCAVISLASYILLTNHYVTVCRLNWWGVVFNIEKSTYCTFLNKATLLISASPLLWLRQFPQLR